jgi:hypothetical protein
MQRVVETENDNQGITPDERMALRQLFDIKREGLVVQEQFIDLLLLQGPIK